jgi:hypothetical protein
MRGTGEKWERRVVETGDDLPTEMEFVALVIRIRVHIAYTARTPIRVTFFLDTDVVHIAVIVALTAVVVEDIFDILICQARVVKVGGCEGERISVDSTIAIALDSPTWLSSLPLFPL